MIKFCPHEIKLKIVRSVFLELEGDILILNSALYILHSKP